MAPAIEIVQCDACGKDCEKPRKEVTRRKKKMGDSVKFFCDGYCYAVKEGKFNIGPNLGVGNTSYLRVGSQVDHLSPFRVFVKLARNRKRVVNITADYLKQVWEDQRGVCPITGEKLTLPSKVDDWNKDINNPHKISLDRIDSSFGYVVGNVRFVTQMANVAKSKFSDKELIDFCKTVAKFHSTVG